MFLWYAVLVLSPLVTAFNADPCGGNLNSTSGTITITSGTADLNKTCTWTIKNTNLKVLQLSLHLNSDPTFTYKNLLEIYDGDKSSGELLFNFTGRSGHAWMVSFSKITTVIYKYTVNDTGSHNITIDFNSEECTQELASGELTPPIYLQGHGDLNCNYKIDRTLSSDYTGVLSFLSFNVPHGQLTVNKANFTGTTLPKDTFSKTLDVSLHFKNSTEDQTFSGVLSQSIDACTGTFDVSTETFHTIPIPSLHSAITECRMIFTSKGNSHIMIEPSDVHLIGADRIVIRDGSSQGDKVLVNGGNDLTGKRILTNGDNAWVRLVLDTFPGSRLVNLTLKPTDSGRFYNKGKITLGDTRGDDGQVADYFYQLDGGSSQVEVTLNQTNINGTIEFYDGLQTTSNLLTTFGPDSSFYKVTSIGHWLLIVARNFTTEKVPASFISTADSCNVVTSDSKGSYSLTKLTADQKQCQWMISPKNTDGVISLKFTSIILRKNDTLTVSSVGTKASKLAEFVGPSQLSFIPEINIPSNERAEILFSTTNNCKPGKCLEPTIEADYSISQVCSGKLQHMGELRSPGWPNVYPLNADCVWTAKENKTSDYKLLYMSFKTLNLPRNHSLTLTILFNGTIKKDFKYTGSKLPGDLIFAGDTYEAHFSSVQQTSDLKAEVGEGFDANYRFLDCGGYINTNKYVIKSPGYPKPPSKSGVCMWLIDVPANTNKSLINIAQIDLKSNEKTTKDKNFLLQIHDGASVRDPVITLNRTSNGIRFLSRTSKLFIVYDLVKTPKIAFTLNYTIYECHFKCDNGVCLHNNWRCNGIDECGDNTDERGCAYPITTTPKPQPSSTGVARYWIALCLLFGVGIGLVLAFVVPHLYRRARYPNYGHLQESNNPIA